MLHFIFLVTRDDLDTRTGEYQYIQLLSEFYKKWIHDTFSKDIEVQCDQMLVQKQSILRRIDTATLLEDHRKRGQETFHFYLCNFRPLWTDCTCEGYHAENFGMIYWQKPKNQNDISFMAQKNCTAVSHELSHEFLRQKKFKKHAELVHDVWSKHIFGDLPFVQYGKNFEPTTKDPYFMTIDTTDMKVIV